MRKVRCLISLFSLSVALVACAGAAAPAAPLPLTQTFQSSDGTTSLHYPAGWVAQELLGQVTIATSQAAVDAPAPTPGQFQVRLFATPINAIQGLPVGATPRDVLQFFAESLSTSGVMFNESSAFNIGERPAARLEGSGVDGQAVVLAADLGGGNYVFASATAAPGEIARFEPTLLAILDSFTYIPFVPEAASPG